MHGIPYWLNPTESARLQHLLGFIAELSRRPAVLGAVVGALGFLRSQKFAIVDPTNVHAFIAGDWGTHMLGWLHFRHASLWHLPLGQVPHLGYPLGTSLLFTDAIPLLGLVLRPFSALLPTDFQYLGLCGWWRRSSCKARWARRSPRSTSVRAWPSSRLPSSSYCYPPSCSEMCTRR